MSVLSFVEIFYTMGLLCCHCIKSRKKKEEKKEEEEEEECYIGGNNNIV